MVSLSVVSFVLEVVTFTSPGRTSTDAHRWMCAPVPCVCVCVICRRRHIIRGHLPETRLDRRVFWKNTPNVSECVFHPNSGSRTTCFARDTSWFGHPSKAGPFTVAARASRRPDWFGSRPGASHRLSGCRPRILAWLVP